MILGDCTVGKETLKFEDAMSVFLETEKFKKLTNNLEVETFVVKSKSSQGRSMLCKKNFDIKKSRSKSSANIVNRYNITKINIRS